MTIRRWQPSATKERTEKQIKLPEFEQFEKLVAEVGRPVKRLCQTRCRIGAISCLSAACRIGEAKFVTWADCDFKRGEIAVRGNPETGLKGRQVGENRIVPMIPDMRKFWNAYRPNAPTKSRRPPSCEFGNAKNPLTAPQNSWASNESPTTTCGICSPPAASNPAWTSPPFRAG